MYMLSMGTGMAMGVPDTCNTPSPAGPVPTPYPNTVTTALCPSAVMTVITGGTPSVNQMSNAMLSTGDEGGAMMGVVSMTLKGSTNWMIGSQSVFVGGMPAQRLTSTGGSNCMGAVPNGVTTCIAPSQVKVLVMK